MCARENENGALNFGILVQIWAVCPNLKIQSNKICNLYFFKNSLVRIALIAVELFQENNNFGEFWGHDWSLTEHVEAPERRWG